MSASSDSGRTRPRTLVVIPTYNERENVEAIVPAVLAVAPEVEVLVVDDGSPDGTGALADALAVAHPGRVHVLHRSGKQGLGKAYLAGFDWALRATPRIERVVQMDADFSHDPGALPSLLAALDDGADVAVGSRWTTGGGVEGWPLQRQFISRGGSFYARTILGVPVRDLTAGFKAWRRATLESLDLATVAASGYGFQIEMTWRALRRRARLVEVPILFKDRTAGASKMSGNIVKEAVILVWKLRLGR